MKKKTLFSKERSYGRANAGGCRSESGRAQHSGKSPYMAPQSHAGGGWVSQAGTAAEDRRSACGKGNPSPGRNPGAVVTEDARLKLAAGHMGFRYAIFSTLESVKFSINKTFIF